MTETSAKGQSAAARSTPNGAASASAAARWKALVAVILIALIVSTAIAVWIARSRSEPKTIDPSPLATH
jgi:hypothetical protein